MSYFRTPSEAYRQLQSRPSTRIIRDTLPASTTRQYLQKSDRHTLLVRNVGTVDVRIMNESGSSHYLTLRSGTDIKFEIHYSGEDGIIYYHSEWDDELHIQNPSSTTSATIEIFEVL